VPYRSDPAFLRFAAKRPMKFQLAAVVSPILFGARPAFAEINRELGLYGSVTFDLGAVWTGTIATAARYSDALNGLSDQLDEVQAERPISSSWSLIDENRFLLNTSIALAPLGPQMLPPIGVTVRTPPSWAIRSSVGCGVVCDFDSGRRMPRDERLRD
jgi:hypothetical protein